MMSDLIRWEGIALLSSLFWGMVYAGIYDCIRIVRRIVRHRKVWLLVVEDIIFWIYVGINVFCITFQLNDGVIRGFSILGYILGAVIYRFTLGWLIMKYVTKIILFILKPLKKLFGFIRIKTKKLIKESKVRSVKRKAENQKRRQAEKVKRQEAEKARQLEEEQREAEKARQLEEKQRDAKKARQLEEKQREAKKARQLEEDLRNSHKKDQNKKRKRKNRKS